ncbi:MAG: hypothetical protein II813_10420 [Spirochaetales bacterium]|nr:hypothetical protein [Spirochaetales bacterium]
MEQINSYSFISFGDFFAYCVKKFLILVVGAIIGMVLFLGFHLVSSNSEKKTNEYNSRMVNYQNNLEIKEKTLENLKSKLEFINELHAENPLLQSDDVFRSRVIISPKSQNDVIITDSGLIVSETLMKIDAIWDGIDLSTVLGSNLDSDILKTFIVYTNNGAVSEIVVYGQSMEASITFASKIKDHLSLFLKEQGDEDAVFSSIETSKASKDYINEQNQHYISTKSDLLMQIEEVESSINELRKSIPSKYHITKNAVLGFFLGGIVSLIILIIGFISRNPITSSFSTEKELSVPFLGAMFIEKGFFAALARRIIGERLFINKDDSENFIRSVISGNSFSEIRNAKSIAVVSSVREKEIGFSFKKICSILEESGYHVVFVYESMNNSKMIDAIESSDAVVLIEKQWVSRKQLIKASIDFVGRMGKKAIGFFIC